MIEVVIYSFFNTILSIICFWVYLSIGGALIMCVNDIEFEPKEAVCFFLFWPCFILYIGTKIIAETFKRL